jgi:hypothetical protein
MTLHLKTKFYSATAFICVTVFFAGCLKDNTSQKQTYTYTITKPVLKSRAEVFAAINGSISEPVNAAGKLYIQNQFIYLNEVEKGVHIIDNSNPSRPKQIAFLNIPGNLDVVVKNNILYADTYTDLLAIDISNPGKAVVVNEIKSFYYAYYNPYPDMIITALITKDTTVIIDENTGVLSDAMLASGSNATKPNSGTSGSMASMVLMNDYIYALQYSYAVGVVNISTPSAPKLDTTLYAGMDLQTMYPFEDKLFLGSMSGMFMYDVSTPAAPTYLGGFSHASACDPVITDGKYAYVTLHAGSACSGTTNELDVIDIKDLMTPTLVKKYNLTKPNGLCKDGNLLFVCDDKSGVRLYNADDVSNLKQLNSIAVNNAYDIIAANNIAIVVASDGLYQYDYSDTKNIRFLSKYAMKKNTGLAF